VDIKGRVGGTRRARTGEAGREMRLGKTCKAILTSKSNYSTARIGLA
jgi:hypothetical protein